MGRECLHLADGDLVEALESLALGQAHMDELGVHAFQVGQHEKLFNRGVVAHVAVERGVLIPPLFGSPAEEGDIQEVCLTCVRDCSLGGGDFRRNEVLFDGIGVDAVVELREGAVKIPGQRETAAFVVFEALEFLDEVKLKLGAEPRTKLEGDVPVGSCCGPLRS
jgi:hypothetical protein